MFDVGDLVRVNYSAPTATHITPSMREIPAPDDGKIGLVVNVFGATMSGSRWVTVVIDGEPRNYITTVLEAVTESG